MENAFLAARHALALLQSKLAEIRAKASNTALPDALRSKAVKLLQTYLKPLQSLHAAVQRFLLLDSDSQRQEGAAALLKHVAEVAEWVDGLDSVEEGELLRAVSRTPQAFPGFRLPQKLRHPSSFTISFALEPLRPNARASCNRATAAR